MALAVTVSASSTIDEVTDNMGKYRSTHTGQEIDTGVTKALNPDSVPSSGSSALITSDAVNKVQQGFAPIETSSAAANNYAVDDLLVYNGVLYKAKTAIYVGDTLTVGTNIEATTISEKLNHVDTQITQNTDTTINGLLKGNGSKVSAETRFIPTVEVTTAQYAALVSGGTVDPDVLYVITDDNSNPVTQADLATRVPKTDLTGIVATGSTNATGNTIANGTYFYLNGTLVQATADIASGATFTNGTNYSAVTAGALNDLRSALPQTITSTDATTVSVSSGGNGTLATLNITEPGNYILYCRGYTNKDMVGKFIWLSIRATINGYTHSLYGQFNEMVGGTLGTGFWIGNIPHATQAFVYVEQSVGQTVSCTCTAFSAVKIG